MAYQPKSYRKFVATAATATLVATAVSPAAAAGFSDVSDKYKEAVDFVVSKGVNGTTSSTFGTSETISRVDAAVMLAKVLGLDTENAPAAGFTDVPARAQGAVNALKAEGITNGKTTTTFGATDKITRGELAVWIQKGFDLEGTADVNFTDVSDKYAAAVSALVANEITSGTSATTFGTTANAKRGDFALFLHRAAEGVAPGVVGVSAITTNKVTVAFNKEVASLPTDNVVVTNKATGQKQYVKSVTLNADKKSATVEFYDKLDNNSTYSFEVKSDDSTLKYDFDYAVTDVAKIEFAAQTVKNGDTLTFKALDANGIDITADVAANLKVVSPSNLISDAGVVTLTAGTSTTAKIVYTNPTTNLKVESDTVTISASAAELASISTYSVSTSLPTWTAADFKQNDTIDSSTTNQSVFVRLVDQFGEDYSLTGTEVLSFESLNTDVAVVDKTTGAITPLGEGTAPVKVSVWKTVDGKQVEMTSKTVSVKVIAPAVAAGLTLTSSNVTVSTKDTVGVWVTGKLVDQYGNPVVGETPVISDADANGTGNDNLVDVTATVTDDKGEFKFLVQPEAAAQAGTYTVNASYTVGTKTIKAPLSVTLKAPGAFYGYAVKGLETTLDKKSGATNASSDVSVVSVDNTGLVIEEESGVTVEVKDKNGVDKTAAAVTGTVISPASLTTGETYTATVKLGDKVIKTQTFNVVDTTLQPLVKFTSSTLNVTNGVDTVADEAALFAKLADILNVTVGDVVQTDAVTAISFVSSNDSVVSDADNNLELGTTTIFVQSIDIDLDGDATADYTQTFKTPVKLTVNVK